MHSLLAIITTKKRHKKYWMVGYGPCCVRSFFFLLFLNLDFYLNKLVFTDPIDSFGRNIKFIYRLSSLNLDF